MTKTLSDQAIELYQRQDFNKLRAFKKAKKKSWAALGINPEMEALIKRDPTIGDEPPKRVTFATRRFDAADVSVLKYTPREIHRIKGQSSHGTIAIMAQVVHQEKFRADVRFPLFQIMERVKRYKAIFAGPPYLPIFA